jgi:hypothetical protein
MSAKTEGGGIQKKEISAVDYREFVVSGLNVLKKSEKERKR